MVERRDVEFEVEGGDRLRGWLFVPENRSARHPAISMAHGYAGVKEHGLERFARAFAEAGFVVLVHDHRNFGSSDGAIRHDIDPWCQIADWRRAICLLESLPEVDADRIGVWGTSYAGGHVLVLAATDRRIRAVVAQVPTISGYQQGLRRVPPDAVTALEHRFDDDERAQFRGEPPRRQLLVGDDPSVPASYRSRDAISFYLQPKADRTAEANHKMPVSPCKGQVVAMRAFDDIVVANIAKGRCVRDPDITLVTGDVDLHPRSVALTAFDMHRENR
jgi:dienelactone hydrolase